MKNILIVGGGLVGSLLSLFFAKKGYAVDVFEKRPDIRKNETIAGRSINLVVSDRGWSALEAAGISERIRKITIPVYGRMTHDENREETFLPYSTDNKAIFSISRAELNLKLIEIAAEFPGVKYHFDEKCVNMDMENSSAIFHNTLTGGQTSVKADIIFGADGANSEVRKYIHKKSGKKLSGNIPFCSEETIAHGYKELVIPPDENGKWKLNENALHIWPRKKFMLMALANLDGGFTCTLFLPMTGENSFENIKDEKDLIKFFNDKFPDALPIMPTLTTDYFSNPTSSLTIVRCLPWVKNGKIALIGDAAHAIVPFYGEGMNCGFEDCLILYNLMGKYGADWDKILKDYETLRKPNADAIAELSLQNFIEMRDLVSDPRFLLRKKIEANIHQKYPSKWIPLYALVKFSNIPYKDALMEGKKQDDIMKKILALDNIESIWNDPKIESQILSML